MSRVFLLFASAFVALIAGALFYAARLPMQEPVAATSAIEQPPAPAADIRPDFALPDVSGKSRDFSEWSGKNRILNFWATWCAPCRREIPLLKAFQDEQQGNGFQVIGIAVDFPDAVAEYAKAAEFNYPVLVGEQDAMAVAESSGVEFIGLPFTMFVASDGELLSVYLGELHQSHLDEVVDVMTRLDRDELSKADARLALDKM